jgi:hypothetical protein
MPGVRSFAVGPVSALSFVKKPSLKLDSLMVTDSRHTMDAGLHSTQPPSYDPTPPVSCSITAVSSALGSQAACRSLPSLKCE